MRSDRLPIGGYASHPHDQFVLPGSNCPCRRSASPRPVFSASPSINRFTRSAQRQGARSQLEELFAAALVPVFLLDEHQVVKPGELGNVDIITMEAKKRNLDVEVVLLHDQFRCGGSEAYEKWVLNLLGRANGKPTEWVGDGRFDLRAAETPEEYESSGVIIGPDLVARDGRLVTNRAAFKDPNFRSRKTVDDSEADRLIRNTYKVLMTRGMRGTILYAVDPATRALLADLVHVHRSLETVYEEGEPAVRWSRRVTDGRVGELAGDEDGGASGNWARSL